MIEIWGRKTSSNVQAVMWAVAELQQHYKRYDIGHRFGGNDTPAFLAMNPNGTVPVVSINGELPCGSLVPFCVIWRRSMVTRRSGHLM